MLYMSRAMVVNMYIPLGLFILLFVVSGKDGKIVLIAI